MQISRQGTATTLKLCQGSKLSSKASYVTLSHCWGRENVYTLTNDNLERLYRSIPWGALSKVFQDAANAAFKLGIQYIWIDSLCIIQDSHDDWAFEASTMGEVYKSAMLNLAATGFYDGRDGLFVSRDPKVLLPLLIDFGLEDEHEHCVLLEENHWDTQVVKSPLNRRGWVFQERLLSSRILHFGREQLLWECQETQCSEIYPSGSKSRMTNKLREELAFNKLNSWKPLKFLLAVSVLLTGSVDLRQEYYRKQLFGEWEATIQVYSTGLLTRPEDKLPALSGAAKEMRHALNDEYLAGLWKSELLPQLLWSIKMQTTSAKVMKYRAPSWSWACVEGEVEYESCGFMQKLDQAIAEVVEAAVLPADVDDTGSVIGGHILIKGLLHEAFPGSKNHEWVIRNSRRAVNVKWDFRIGSEEGQKILPFEQTVPSQSYWDSREILEEEAKTYLKQVYLLPLVTQQDMAKGLVLIPCNGLKGHFTRIGSYKHIGFFDIMPSDSNKLPKRDLDEMCDWLSKDRDVLESDLYQSYDGHGNYTVRII